MDGFELLTGHVAHLATRIECLATLTVGLAADVNDNLLTTAAAALMSLRASVAAAWQNDDVAAGALRLFHDHAPEASLRDAAQVYEDLPEIRQNLIVAVIEGALLETALFGQIKAHLRTQRLIGETQWAEISDAEEAAELLLGLRCLISGASPGEVRRAEQQVAKLILATEKHRPVVVGPESEPEHVSTSVDAEQAACEYDRFGPQRYAIVDLEHLDSVGRDIFEQRVRGWFVDTALSSHPDKQRHLWKAIVGDAVRQAPWRPPFVDARPISLKPASDVIIRRATRVLAMVAELHKAGYQQVRISPGLSPSGAHWRCSITFAGNVKSDGFSIRYFDTENRLVAPYTSAEQESFFGWPDGDLLNARHLAVRLLQDYPRIAVGGSGRDWLYAGWFADIFGRAEQGSPQDLPIFNADSIRTWPPEWLPPPVLRT